MAGFKTQHFRDPAEAAMRCSQTLPMAIIIEVDFPQAPLAGIRTIAELSSRIEQQIPVIFITSHQDMAIRLEAVRAGGRGYFTRPLDVTALIEKLSGLLFKEATAAPQRMLIVSDNRAESRHMSHVLEAQGITTQIRKPLEVVETLQQFQPDGVILDIDLKDVDGLELVMVLRQHDNCYAIPMMVLCEENDWSQRLPQLKGLVDDLLVKPVADDHLSWLAKQRLHRSRHVAQQAADIER